MNIAIMNNNPQRRNELNQTKVAQGKARGKARKRSITRTEARRRAARYVSKRMFSNATVLDGADARLNIHFPVGWTQNDLWVVYENPDNVTALRSSNIVAVCKRTGRVLYEGSAGDEG